MPQNDLEAILRGLLLFLFTWAILGPKKTLRELARHNAVRSMRRAKSLTPFELENQPKWKRKPEK